MRHAGGWLALVACVLGCAVATGTAPASADGGFHPWQVGERMPDYATRTLDGGARVRVGAGGPLTLVNIWATWCGPCRREFPELQRLHALFHARGLRVLAVSVDVGSDAPVQAFARQAGARFRIGRDAAGLVRQRYRAIGVPETFLVGGDGTLLWHKVGAIAAGGADARAAVEAALARDLRH